MATLKKLLVDHEIVDLVVLVGVSLLVILVLLALAESMSALFDAIGVSYDAQQAGLSDGIRGVFVGLAQIIG
jgi:hypothetical protein